jgi:hypothetical protein
VPSPKRADVDDYFAQLTDVQRPYVERLRALSLAADADLVEQLAWNNPAYLMGTVRAWMLQSYKAHCSLRFPPPWYAEHRAGVDAAGLESGEGFLKVVYAEPFPEEQVTALMRARLEGIDDTTPVW